MNNKINKNVNNIMKSNDWSKKVTIKDTKDAKVHDITYEFQIYIYYLDILIRRIVLSTK